MRSATVIDGTGAPPIGPLDIIVENGRIVSMKKMVGYGYGVSEPADHEIDCRGKWVTPGFVDCHGHAGVSYHSANGWVPPVDYVYKLCSFLSLLGIFTVFLPNLERPKQA